MAKIGILYFIPNKDRVGGIGGRSPLKKAVNKNCELFQSPKLTIGFTQIISEIDKIHQVDYVDVSDEWADYWLASLVSWYDVYNLIRALKGRPPKKARLIIGGAGVINPWILQDMIYAACIGRGEGLINRIIDGDLTIPNVFYSTNPDRIITIGQATQQISTARETEAAIGCPKKCFFCEYGWKYKYINWSGQYSEYSNGETFFQDIDFLNIGHATAGLDGITERERAIVNKPLSRYKIIETLSKHTKRDNYRLKLFCVTGYPFTDGYNFNEWEDTLREAAKYVKKPITIMLSISHFCPMPFTPMEEDRVVFCDRQQQAPIKVGNIKWGTYLQGTTYSSAAYEAMLYRGLYDDKIADFVLLNAPSGETAYKIREKYPYIIQGGYLPVPLIQRYNSTEKAKKIYKQRIAACLQ